MTRAVSCWLVALIFGLVVSPTGAVTLQNASMVFEGRPYLWLEAENFASRNADEDANGWTLVNAQNPITSTGGLDILPAGSNVSGTALLDLPEGGQHSDTVLYELQFQTPGTYQLYTRHSMYDFDGNLNYGNEDSVFLSPAFNRNSESDWVGFEGLDFDENDINVDIPNPGFALDPDGFKPAVADAANDGWYAIRDWGVKSNGSVTFPNDALANDWNGNFNWYNRPAFVSTNTAGGFDSDFGFKTEYVVTPQMVGQTLTFEMGTREPYGVFDGFLFIQDDNVDLLDNFSQTDVDAVLPANTPHVRNYNVQFTSTPPTIDGVVGAGEWDAAEPTAGDWRELRDGFQEMDSDGNRFQILYDNENLYILYQTDYVGGPDGDMWLTSFGGSPDITFGEENLNIYIDPNRDGDLNTLPDGTPSDANTPNDANVDGYQIAFNQYENVGGNPTISTDTNRNGIGFYTEAHANTAFGDQANWNEGGSNVGGAGLAGSGITVAQNNTNSPAAGEPSGIVEIVIPFADLDADAMIAAPGATADYNGDGVQNAADYTMWRDTLGDDVGGAGDGLLNGADGDDNGIIEQADYDLWKAGFGAGAGSMVATGLNATDDGARSGPEAGEVWGFNMSMITRDGDDGENFLPIWNFQTATGFALWPHGTITFLMPNHPLRGSGAGIPEPGSLLLLVTGLTAVWAGYRRR